MGPVPFIVPGTARGSSSAIRRFRATMIIGLVVPPIVPLLVVVVVAAVLIVLPAPLDGALVVGVEADSPPRFVADALALLDVAGRGAGGGALGEEEGEEFVGDGEVRRLLELLQREQAEEGLEEGERGADWREGWWWLGGAAGKCWSGGGWGGEVQAGHGRGDVGLDGGGSGGFIGGEVGLGIEVRVGGFRVDLEGYPFRVEVMGDAPWDRGWDDLCIFAWRGRVGGWCLRILESGELRLATSVTVHLGVGPRAVRSCVSRLSVIIMAISLHHSPGWDGIDVPLEQKNRAINFSRRPNVEYLAGVGVKDF